MLEISSFFTCVPKITVIRCMVPEMQNETDRIFCHFGPFFVLLPLTNDPENQNIKKNEKMPKDIILLCIHVYYK